jgi:hypothetical protein
MNRALNVGIAAAIVAVLVPVASFAQQTPKVTPASAPTPTPSSAARAGMPGMLPADKGTLRLLLNGTEVGSEQFELSANGGNRVVRSEAVIHLPGQPETRSQGELLVAPDGSPLSYKWTAQAEKKASGSVQFKDGSAQTLLDMEAGKDPFQSDFMFSSPHVAILDNNLNYQGYTLLAQLYDWNAKGVQMFPVLIPQDMTPGEISVESLGQKTIEGSKLETLRISTADLEILAYYDARLRLMRMEVPSAMVTVVRR